MTEPAAPAPKRLKESSALKRAAITLAILVLAAVLLEPAILVAAGGERFGKALTPRFGNVLGKLYLADATRAFTLPKDSTITADRAGAAFHLLGPSKEQPTKFVFKPVPPRPMVPWREDSLPPELFPKAHTQVWIGPNPSNILESAPAGFTRDEMEYLERLAHAPVWADVDVVARANAVDIIGGRFVLPFPDSVAAFEFPLIRFNATKEFAYASVSRAAYYLARHDRDSAELALKTIPSLGFALVDNGTSAIDQLIGAVIVGIGRDALIRFYTIANNPAATSLKVAADTLGPRAVAMAAASAKAPLPDRDALIASVKDERLARGVRFEQLSQLALLPCTNVRELIAGPGQDVVETFAWARQHLARYPSEVAYIDLASRLLSHEFSIDENGPGGLAVGVASLASAITGNRRFAACVSLMAGMR